MKQITLHTLSVGQVVVIPSVKRHARRVTSVHSGRAPGYLIVKFEAVDENVPQSLLEYSGHRDNLIWVE